ncbi:hypothetical protein ANO14919_102430 [Xylariales sp. No.14919]|nr:hypothetical protein ANO14919_102430 [Xylariales sp. No.14919]
MEHNPKSTAGVEQLPAATDYAPQLPLSEPNTARTKRDFTSAFPCVPPGRGAKRCRSHSPVRPAASRYEDNDEALDNKSHTIDATANDTVGEFYEMEQARSILPFNPACLQETPVTKSNVLGNNGTSDLYDAERLIEYSRDGIRQHIEVIKQNRPDAQIDFATAKVLFDEMMNFIPASDLATPEDIARMRRIFFPSDDALTPRAKLECDQVVSQDGTSPLSELASISPPPSFRLNEASSPATTGVGTRNAPTQTEPVLVNAHNDTPDIPVTYHQGLSETELWKRELESIRRHQPIVRGSYKTVDVPLRKTAARPRPLNRSTVAPVPKSMSTGISLPSHNVISHNYGEKDNDVISILASSDDEDRGMPTPKSHRVGGGDFTPVEDGDLIYIDSDGQIIHDPSSLYEGSTVQNNNYYEESEIVDNMVHYDNDAISEDHDDSKYDNDQSEYQQAEFFEKGPCPVKQYYPLPNKRDNSLTQAHCGEARNARRMDAGDNYSVRASHENLYNYAEERYIRDDPENASFYGYRAYVSSSKEAERALRYQDRFHDVGEIPGPKSSLRLKLDEYVRDAGSNVACLERDIERVTKATFYAGQTLDEEQAFQESWAKQVTLLYKGFPLVEDVGFVAVSNHANPQGDCYWRSLAYTLYGKSARWNMIKADHYAYMLHVLSDKTHPRHQLYAKLNTQFFETEGGLKRSGKMNTPFKANIWQLLHLPHSWTPGVMQQITADLYNVHLVTFTYDEAKNMCSEVGVRGAYNSRHIFMLFVNGCHFQPLAVNEYLS